MQKIVFAFLSILFFSKSLFAFELDRSQLAIQAKIYPQLIFFATKIKDLKQQKPIVIVAVYTENTKKFAEGFKDECEKLYPNGIKGYRLLVRLVQKEKLSGQKDFTASYLFFDDEDTSKAYEISDFHGVLTFASTKRVFEKNGALFFVEITNKTSILLNKKALNASGLSFDPSLLKMVKVYDE
jgi:hypothetical protein